ncbi:alpha/beta fold hydrolase [Kribbella sp. NPDC023972]|uniref:alpha/beta fold hydrolase n=1 Tax=Kribbella sp. NPDC023972 TaxID=3154795 RepID=UPI0033D61840
MSSNLGWIAPAVASDTRVCVYDRAGRGWSEPADAPQDGAQTATDLHTLLQRGNVPGPYVLAGHSFGGLYVQTFAARYPDEVAGMGAGGLHRTEIGDETGCTIDRRRGLLRHHRPCLHTGFDLGSTWSDPPVRPARKRQPAAAVPGRGTRQRRDRKQSPQHDRRVRPGERVDGAGCISR